ncbi:hypothetical protein, partial [Nostoc sp.]|uniref:hypothetical protein n=1 Tax=Nostoc sp. TaxID=1180 RepID=UPI002FFD31E1
AKASLEVAKASLEVAKASLEVAKASLEVAKASLEVAKAGLMYTQVELPPLIPPWKGGKQEIQFPPLYKAIAGGLWVSLPATGNKKSSSLAFARRSQVGCRCRFQLRETRNPVPSPLQGEG